MPSLRLKPKPVPGKVDSGVCGKGWTGFRGQCVRAVVANRKKTQDTFKTLKKNAGKAKDKAKEVANDPKVREKAKKFGKETVHSAEHLAENVAAWKIGKIVGGAVSAVAAAKGHDTQAVQLITETVVQASAMTLMYSRKKENRDAGKLAEKFVAEAAAAFIGKSAHGMAESATSALGQSETVQKFSSLIAGKGAGAITSVSAMRSGMAKVVADSILKRRGDAEDAPKDSGDIAQRKLGLSSEQLYDLSMAAYAIAMQEKTSETKRRVDHMDALLSRRGDSIARRKNRDGSLKKKIKYAKPGKSGKRPPGKKCGKSYISHAYKCKSHYSKNASGKSVLNEEGKRSSRELARKFRAQRGLSGKNKGKYTVKETDKELLRQLGLESNDSRSRNTDDNTRRSGERSNKKPEVNSEEWRRIRREDWIDATPEDFIQQGRKFLGEKFFEKAKANAERYVQLEKERSDTWRKIADNNALEAINSEEWQSLKREFDNEPTYAKRRKLANKLGKVEIEIRRRLADNHPDVLKLDKELEEAASFTKEAKAKILSTSTLSRADAESIVKRIKKPRKSASTDPTMEETMVDFAQMTSGAATNLKQIKKTQNRAHASQEGGYAQYNGTKEDHPVLWHEMAHHLEFSQIHVLDKAEQFIKSRATSDSMQPLRYMTGNKRYKLSEKAFPDHFVTPYVGKVYKNRAYNGEAIPSVTSATEAVSVGMEHFATPRGMAKLASKDPDHFAFMVGMMLRMRNL